MGGFGIGDVQGRAAYVLRSECRNERVGVDDPPRATLTTTAFVGSVARAASSTSPG